MSSLTFGAVVGLGSVLVAWLIGAESWWTAFGIALLCLLMASLAGTGKAL